MYKKFTKDEQFNFTAQFGMVDYIFNIEGLSDRAKFVYHTLLAELKWLFHKGEIKIDHDGIYVEKARTEIGKLLGKCSHTVAKYITELQNHGLLIKKRMGFNMCNRIYLKYPEDAKRYQKEDKKKITIKDRIVCKLKRAKNNDVKPASETSKKNTQLIKKSNEIISQLNGVCLQENEIKQLLILCNEDLSELDMAVKYCLGKPFNNACRKIADTLRNKYYNKKDKPKDKEPKQPKSYSRNKRGFGDGMVNHDWDEDYLLKLEYADGLLVDLTLGNISQDEYDSEIKKLNLR